MRTVRPQRHTNIRTPGTHENTDRGAIRPALPRPAGHRPAVRGDHADPGAAQDGAAAVLRPVHDHPGGRGALGESGAGEYGHDGRTGPRLREEALGAGRGGRRAAAAVRAARRRGGAGGGAVDPTGGAAGGARRRGGEREPAEPRVRAGGGGAGPRV